MGKGRLEAFSDGVIAIIITIMVLDLKVPQGSSIATLRPLLSTLVCYVLSFVFVGIYWNNHHHMLHAVTKISGGALWANLHLLFWLSLVPFVTSWMANNHFASLPVSLYGVVLLMAGVAYYILERTLVHYHGGNSPLATALGDDAKGMVSLVIYTAAVPLAFVNPIISCVCYILVAVMWFIPDRRIEKVLGA